MKRLISGTLELFFPLAKKLMSYEIYAYLAVGAANTILNLVIYAVSYQFILPEGKLNLFLFSIESYTLSLLIAFLITVPTGFWLSKNFAFNASGKTGKSAKQLGKYFLVVLQGLASDYILLISLILLVGFHPTIAKLLATIIVLSVNFLLQKYFTFRVKTA